MRPGNWDPATLLSSKSVTVPQLGNIPTNDQVTGLIYFWRKLLTPHTANTLESHFLSRSILTRLCSYEGFGLWCSIDLVPKLTSYALSMDFSTNTQQSTSLDTKEWKTHVVIRTWLCQLPSWAWTYGQVRKKVTDGKRGRKKSNVIDWSMVDLRSWSWPSVFCLKGPYYGYCTDSILVVYPPHKQGS